MPLPVFYPLLLIVMLGLSACSSSKKPAQEDVFIVTEQIFTIEETQHKLRAGDTLHIRFYAQDQLSGTYTIQPNMTIILPLVGSLPIDGLSEASIAAMLTDQFQTAQLLKNPDIHVERVID